MSSNRRFQLLCLILSILAFSGLLAVGSVQAATFYVNSGMDDSDANPGDGVCLTVAGQCTIRAAIQEANALAGADTIVIPAGIFHIGSLLPITSDITINGVAPNTTVIDGGGSTRLFDVSATGTLTITGCTLQGGHGSGYAGAIESQGILLVDRCYFTENTNGFGNNGAAIYQQGPSATITNSLFVDNQAGGNGGAIANFGNSRMTLTNCTFSGNSAGGYGGAINNNGGMVTLTNVTIAGNTSTGAAGWSGGGGINLAGGTITMVNVILWGNSEVTNGSPDCKVGWGTFSSLGNNLIGTTTGCTISGLGSSDLVGVDPLLASPQQNGGGTWTMALFRGSPAIDAGSDAACPATDARGVSRPKDGDGDGTARCDIGAFEFDPSAVGVEPLYVLGTAYTTGVGGTHWKTDLEIHNRGAAQASFSVALLPWNQPNLAPTSYTYTLDPGKSVRYANIVQSMFGFTGSATLRVLPLTGDVMAMSRSYNDSATGTYGQGIVGISASQAWHAGAAPCLIQLGQSTTDNSGFRTNLSLANVTAVPVNVRADYYRSDGTLIDSRTYPLRAFESQQITRCFRTVTSNEVADGHIVLSTTSPGGKFLAGAHLVDQLSGDPMFVPAW